MSAPMNRVLSPSARILVSAPHAIFLGVKIGFKNEIKNGFETGTMSVMLYYLRYY